MCTPAHRHPSSVDQMHLDGFHKSMAGAACKYWASTWYSRRDWKIADANQKRTILCRRVVARKKNVSWKLALRRISQSVIQYDSVWIEGARDSRTCTLCKSTDCHIIAGWTKLLPLPVISTCHPIESNASLYASFAITLKSQNRWK
jgi:hypothetical protein